MDIQEFLDEQSPTSHLVYRVATLELRLEWVLSYLRENQPDTHHVVLQAIEGIGGASATLEFQKRVGQILREIGIDTVL